MLVSSVAFVFWNSFLLSTIYTHALVTSLLSLTVLRCSWGQPIRFQHTWGTSCELTEVTDSHSTHICPWFNITYDPFLDEKQFELLCQLNSNYFWQRFVSLHRSLSVGLECAKNISVLFLVFLSIKYLYTLLYIIFIHFKLIFTW